MIGIKDLMVNMKDEIDSFKLIRVRLSEMNDDKKRKLFE